MGTKIDMGILLRGVENWEPDLFIAKVDAFQTIVPVNVKALKCPKVLILGDTQHGRTPLRTMLEYAREEKYDYYITDHKKHHLWFYWLAGIKNLSWIPGLFLTPLKNENQEINIPQIQNKSIFIGQVGKHHPYRQPVIEYLNENAPDTFELLQTPQQESLHHFNQAKSSLNISLNGDLNLRTFEIISNKGLLIHDQLSVESGLDDILKPQEDYIPFNTKHELLEIIESLDKKPNKN